MSINRFRKLAAGLLGIALAASVVIANSTAAEAAVVNTPVWIGAGYNGSYGSEATQPGSHGGNQVAFDFFAPAGTAVNIYAAPRNTAFNNNITAHIIQTGISTTSGPGDSAATCGYYARVNRPGSPGGLVGYATSGTVTAVVACR